MRKYTSAFVCGFGAGVLQTVPIAKSFSCCLIIPLAAFLALMLDRRANPTADKISIKRALVFGALTGFYSAIFGSFFDLFITLITKNNDIIASFPELQRMITTFPLSSEIKKEVMNLLQIVRNDIMRSGFSPLYAFSVIINNLIINTIFGCIGGLIGSQIINNKTKKFTDSPK